MIAICSWLSFEGRSVVVVVRWNGIHTRSVKVIADDKVINGSTSVWCFHFPEDVLCYVSLDMYFVEIRRMNVINQWIVTVAYYMAYTYTDTFACHTICSHAKHTTNSNVISQSIYHRTGNVNGCYIRFRLNESDMAKVLALKWVQVNIQ